MLARHTVPVKHHSRVHSLGPESRLRETHLLVGHKGAGGGEQGCDQVERDEANHERINLEEVQLVIENLVAELRRAGQGAQHKQVRRASEVAA